MYTILYVDDEHDLLDLGKLFLERTKEFQVEIALSAKEALASPAFQSCDAIVSDYMMPEMDGIAFLKAVRERSGSLPFILFTGRGREEVVIEAINNGVDFYLQKGGDPKSQFAELSHKIRMAVERKRAVDELRSACGQLAASQEELKDQLSELKASEELLRESEEKYRTLVEHTEDGVFIAQEGKLLFVNHTFTSLTGYAAEELTGKPFAFLVAPEDREMVIS
jgi:DNA-binding response OmpR family regulator